MSAAGEPEVRVRAFDSGDVEDLVETFQQPGCIAGTLQMPFREPEELRERFRGRVPGMWRLVAEVEHEGRARVVGVLTVHQHQRPRRDHAGELGMLVHDRWQGRGIGGKLLRAGTELADRWLGLTRLELTVFADNARAIRLYESCGFEVEGRLRRYALRDGQWVDSLAMARLKAPV